MIIKVKTPVAGNGPFSLPHGRLLFCPDPAVAEDGLFTLAAAGRKVAQIWHGPQSLVVPSSYKRFSNLDKVRAQYAAAGCPVFLRKSGGGLVPQGPGIINLSLAWPIERTFGEAAEDVYRYLCGI